MKIGLLTEKYLPDHGGLAVSSARLAEGLQSAGCSVRVFTLGTIGEEGVLPGSVQETTQAGVRVYRLAPFARKDETLAAWFDAVMASHNEDSFDLLQGYYLVQAGFVSVYAARTIGIPAVISARGNDLDLAVFEPGKAAHILNALQNASKVTANTHELQKKAQALLTPDSAEKVVYLPNGVDTNLFRPLERPAGLAGELDLDGSPVIGFSGEARSKKGLAVLLLAFSEAATVRPLTLMMAGDIRSGMDKDLFKVFQKQNPHLKILHLPHKTLSEMPAVYALMDVLVLPSLHDGLPNALLEGMACERPIVAAPVGGMADILVNGFNALLTRPGDSSDLAQAILTLLDQPELAARLGRQARQVALEKFTPEAEIQACMNLYKDLL